MQNPSWAKVASKHDHVVQLGSLAATLLHMAEAWWETFSRMLITMQWQLDKLEELEHPAIGEVHRIFSRNLHKVLGWKDHVRGLFLIHWEILLLTSRVLETIESTYNTPASESSTMSLVEEMEGHDEDHKEVA